ncbi:MAG: phage tail sheath C-terminal domain-containing protein [Solitalea sp.]
MAYKTPGVYLEEIALFPPSVAAVATAIPAFVGHTRFARDREGGSLINQPVRIASLLEFDLFFGGAYEPARFQVAVDPSFKINAVRMLDEDGNERRYFLYDALRLYFDNGGGPCYIVSVGDYTDPVEFGADDVSGIRGGLKALEKVDEPTLLLVPDSVALDAAGAAQVHTEIAAQCGRLKDRFGVLDLVDGHLPENGVTGAPFEAFRNGTGTEHLHYVAAYYPWLYSVYQKKVSFTRIAVVDQDTPPNPVAIEDVNNLVADLQARLAEEDKLFNLVTAVTLTRDQHDPAVPYQDLLYGEEGIFDDSTKAANIKARFTVLVRFVREMALAFPALESDPALPAPIKSLLGSLKSDPNLRQQLINLIGYEANPVVSGLVTAAADYSSLYGTDWVDGETQATIPPDATDYQSSGGNLAKGRAAAGSAVLKAAFDSISLAFSRLIESSMFRSASQEDKLFREHPFYKAAYERIRRESSLVPPSGAVTGVYAATDRTRGVWKAPANIALRSVSGPSVKLSDRDQESLNVHPTGKSINAIREFTGKGTLVWGARTLDGNSNEWRYVSVRRFFNMVEESTKKATEPFVFEPNDANTWVKVRAMIENFLTLQWRAGALAGAKPEHAFYVRVGLGQTMTAQDILEGRMIVEIGMAVVRPAEFIILRFSHKMQES